MNGACLSLVYYATINCNDKNYKPKLYKGSCEKKFKKRYSNRKKLYNVPLWKHDTKLLTEYWSLKNEATETTDLLENKRNMQVLWPNFIKL